MPRKKDPSPPEDELTQRLRAAARKRRPWTIQGILILLALIVVPVGLLVWWTAPRPEPPRVEVVAFDVLGLPASEVMLHARLEPAEQQEDTPDLAGYPLVFQEGPILPGQKAAQVKKVTSGAGGEARVGWTFDEDKEYLVHYPGDKKRRSARDRAHVFMRPPETPLLVIDVHQVLSAESTAGWATKNILDIQPLAAAAKVLQEARKKKHQPVYLATSPESALQYRRARGWVENRILGREAFPAGPILGRNSYSQDASAARQEVLRSLREHYHGGMVAVVGEGEAAAVCRAVGVDTILIGADDAPKEIIRVKSLQELPEHLK